MDNQELAELLLKAIGGKSEPSKLNGNANTVLKKALASSNNAQLLHGNRGLFSPAMEQPILSTHIGHFGIADFLPAISNNYDAPYFGVFTGVGAAVGSEASSACSDAPVAYGKVGTLTAKWGKVIVDTNTIEWTSTARQVNRGDFMDYQLVNQALNSGNYSPQINGSDVLRDVTAAEMFYAGTAMERKLATMMWTGNATIQSITGGYSEFAGLENQIRTGQVDALTNSAMASADSEVINFLYGNISTGTDIVEPLEEMEDTVCNKALGQGVMLNAAIVMRPEMWREVSSLWPIKYNTQDALTAAQTALGARLIIDARMNVEQRDAMRQSQILLLNGRPYPVIIDTGIALYNSSSGVAQVTNNQFSSSIYFVPITANGFPVCRLEYRDQRVGFAPAGMNPTWFATDDGRFLWSYDQQYSCWKMKLTAETRIVLSAPQYAFKLQNVKFVRGNSPAVDPNPSSAYWRNGGVSIRSAATQNAPWL